MENNHTLSQPSHVSEVAYIEIKVYGKEKSTDKSHCKSAVDSSYQEMYQI